jgi:hypothetical protein
MNDHWMNYSMMCCFFLERKGVCYIERDVFHSINDDDILYCFQGYKSRGGILPHRLGKFLYLYQ